MKIKIPYYPIILVRGFDPTGASVSDPFNGFNDGTVYQDTIDSNRIFEGFVVSFLKEDVHQYKDTTNVIRFHSVKKSNLYDETCFTVSSPDIRDLLNFPINSDSSQKTFWVFRYYDAVPQWIGGRRHYDLIPFFARELQRYITAVKELTGSPKVNIICHSMGGIIVRHLIQRRYFTLDEAEKHINRIVSLGTPHKGIRYLSGFLGSAIANLAGLLEPMAMDPEEIANPPIKVTQEGPDCLPPSDKIDNRYGLSEAYFTNAWNLDKWLCVVGTRYQDYMWQVPGISKLIVGKQSDGLVNQKDAVLDGAPKAYLHKIHGGYDSLISCRESFEVSTRFIFGTHFVKMYLKKGSVLERLNKFGQYYVGTSVKPRGVDFFLSLVDRVSENTISLFKPGDITSKVVEQNGEGVLTEDILVYEGALDINRSTTKNSEMCFRIDFVIFVEDDPLAGGNVRDGSFLMWHNDHRPVSEQIIVKVDTNSGELRWYESSAATHTMAASRADMLSRGAISIDRSENILVYDDLPLKVKSNLNASFRIEVKLREKEIE